MNHTFKLDYLLSLPGEVEFKFEQEPIATYLFQLSKNNVSFHEFKDGRILVIGKTEKETWFTSNFPLNRLEGKSFVAFERVP